MRGVIKSIPAGFTDPALAGARELQRLRRLFEARHAEPLEVRLVVQHLGTQADVALPGSWSAELLQQIAVLLSGNAVQWGSAEAIAQEDEIGTAEVARILGVSAPTATKVLDRGDIPSRLTPSGHRRVSE